MALKKMKLILENWRQYLQEDISDYTFLPADEDTLFDALEQSEVLSDVDGYDLMDKAEKLFSDSGIRIMRNEELYEIVLDGEDVVGASVTSLSNNEEGERTLRFSIAVSPETRRQGIAKKLVTNIIDDNPDTKLEAWVVNEEAMVPLLSDLGFEGYGGESDPFMYLYT
jgi:ribosomal protein S18 acetylase RimI-like enzyme